MSNHGCVNWLDSISWEIDFYSRLGRAKRTDPEFEWPTYERGIGWRLPEPGKMARRLLENLKLARRPAVSLEWVRRHSSELWETRRLLWDDLSRVLFDASLVLRSTNHRHYYYPRIDFEDIVEIVSDEPFAEPGYPHDYLGAPLRVFGVLLTSGDGRPRLSVITRRIQLLLVNSYRQYLVTRRGVDFGPTPGEVVFDCGACIGEISLLFAGMVAPAGEVHLFDPIPLHTRFCGLQLENNPACGGMFHINTLAVGGETRKATASPTAVNEIVPYAKSMDDFPSTTLDDYALGRVPRVDYIKMDIEGAEMAALKGAALVIENFKPRLAISAYHKPEDLWEIPQRLRSLNPNYEICFGHHTPIKWESVFYAVDRDRIGPASRV